MADTVPVEFKKQTGLSHKLIPLIFCAGIVILDQITKLLIIKNIAPGTIGFSCMGDFLRIVHVRNLGAAFSVFAGLSPVLRHIILSIIPVIFLIFVMIIYFKNNDFSYYQRWLICGIVGGGIGNLIDRIFRPGGVVDFISIKFYNLFNIERFPTFNVADSFITVCGILLLISFICTMVKDSKKSKGNTNE